MSSDFVVAEARRERIAVNLGIAGPSNSGKTMSGLILALALADGGPIGMIDTENKRGEQYAPPPGRAPNPPHTFAFKHINFQPPFTADRYFAAHRKLVEVGCRAIVIDSGTHIWDGEGGVKDQHDRAAAALQRAGVSERKASGMSWTCKGEYRTKLFRFLRDNDTHTIWLLRAIKRTKIVETIDQQTGKKRSEFVPVGFQPVCEEGFMYDMTAAFTLHPDAPGRIQYDVGMCKMTTELSRILKDGSMVTAEIGVELRKWANEGAIVADRAADGVQAIIDAIQDAGISADPSSALATIVHDLDASGRREWLRTNRPDLSSTLEAAIKGVRAIIETTDEAR